jgi:hypothetical protein
MGPFYLPEEPRHERGAVGKGLDVNMFMKRVGTIANRAKSVQRGNPQRGGEIPVRSAPGAAFSQVLTERMRDFPRLLVQTLDLQGAFQGRPVDSAACLNRRPRVDRTQAAEDSVDLRRRLGRRDPHVDHGPRLIGDDVGPEPAGYLHDVDRDAANQVLKPVDAEDLMRELVNGTRALLRLDARMRGDTPHQELIAAAPLPRGFDGATRQRRLEDQHCIAAPCFLLDGRARRRAADLLVGRPQHHDAVRDRRAGFEERARGEHADGDAGLHVEYAWPVEPAV